MVEHDDDQRTARVAIPGPGDLRADAAALIAAIAPPGREPARTMAVLAYQPDLLAPFLGWAAALALSGGLSNRDHELLALRVASNCRSAFEWGEHVDYAMAAGITDAEIDAVAADGDVGAWTDKERALLRAADELHAGVDLADATWAALREHFATGELVEIVFVVGQYTMLSMVANATGIATTSTLAITPTDTSGGGSGRSE